jgi:hypothetical protein
MWAEIEQVLREAMRQIGTNVADFLPGVVVALLLVLVTFVVALLVRVLLVRALRGLDFDRRSEQWGLSPLVGVAPAVSPTQALVRVVYWTMLVLGLLVSLTALNASMPSMLALSVFEYLPHLVAALMILVVGAVVARFLAQSVLIGAVNMQMQSARLLSLSVKWMVRLVAVAMALDHLAIGRTILQLAFGIFFGAVMLAAALAVGLGAKDAVSRALARPSEPAPSTDRVDHV